MIAIHKLSTEYSGACLFSNAFLPLMYKSDYILKHYFFGEQNNHQKSMKSET